MGEVSSLHKTELGNVNPRNDRRVIVEPVILNCRLVKASVSSIHIRMYQRRSTFKVKWTEGEGPTSFKVKWTDNARAAWLSEIRLGGRFDERKDSQKWR